MEPRRCFSASSREAENILERRGVNAKYMLADDALTPPPCARSFRHGPAFVPAEELSTCQDGCLSTSGRPGCAP
jgi:hypothetical protein